MPTRFGKSLDPKPAHLELTQKQGISRNKFIAEAVKEEIKREKKK